MVRLYRGLHLGESLVMASQRAQLELLHTSGTAHPYFRAPFIVLGDWR